MNMQNGYFLSLNGNSDRWHVTKRTYLRDGVVCAFTKDAGKPTILNATEIQHIDLDVFLPSDADIFVAPEVAVAPVSIASLKVVKWFNAETGKHTGSELVVSQDHYTAVHVPAGDFAIIPPRNCRKVIRTMSGTTISVIVPGGVGPRLASWISGYGYKRISMM